MCLGIPMKVVEVDRFEARCSAKGIERTVSLFMLQDQTVAPDDWVLVHVGYAIQKLTEEDAATTWELLDQVLAAEESPGLVVTSPANHGGE